MITGRRSLKMRAWLFGWVLLRPPSPSSGLHMEQGINNLSRKPLHSVGETSQQPRPQLDAKMCLIVALSCVVVFAVALFEVKSNRFFGPELTFRDRFAAIFRGTLPFDTLPLLNDFSLVGLLGYGRALALLLLAVVPGTLIVHLLRRGNAWLITVLIVSLSGSLASSWAYKHLVVRSLLDGTGHTFPSGHACGSVVLFSILAYASRNTIRRRRLQIAALAINVMLGVLIGMSTLTQHYISEVIGGYALGGTWLAVVFLCFGPRVSRELCKDTRKTD